MKGLQNARKMAGLTQKQASEQLGIPLSTLRRWEQGVNEPDAASISKMADFYGVTTDYILGSCRVSDPAPTSDPAFDALARNYRALGPEGRAALVATSDALAKQLGNVPGGGCSMPDSAGDR